jgi:23S rRNA (guanosine2251-2'-O)-methyltransferase
MPGNSSRRGAIKRTGKGNPTAGSGGRVKRGLEGKGPTPKAKDREGHVAHKRAKRADKGAPRRRPTRASGDAEWVAGRNSVVELLRAQMPVTAVYVAEGAERDGRLREAFRVAADRGIALLEVGRGELDRLTSGAVHQGLAARVPAYEYAHPDDLLQRAKEAGEPPLIVALDSVTDPRNLGAVVRSASGFGAHGVLVPERRSAGMTASAWKTSAGAAARLPVAQATNLTRQGAWWSGWPPTATCRSPSSSSPTAPWCWSSAPRVTDCPGWSPRPATSCSASRWRGGSSRSTRASRRRWRCTRWPGRAASPGKAR